MKCDGTHVRQDYNVVGTILHDFDEWAFEDLVGEVQSKTEFANGEAELQAASITTELDPFIEVGDVVASTVEDLSVNGLDVEVEVLHEATLSTNRAAELDGPTKETERDDKRVRTGKVERKVRGGTYSAKILPHLNSVSYVKGWWREFMMISAAFFVPEPSFRRPPSSVRSSQAKRALSKSQRTPINRDGTMLASNLARRIHSHKLTEALPVRGGVSHSRQQPDVTSLKGHPLPLAGMNTVIVEPVL